MTRRTLRSTQSRAVSAALVGLVVLAAASPALAQQYARPDGTNSSNRFDPIGAATLHEATDETSASDSDYAFTTSRNGRVEFSLSALAVPASSSNHVLRLRAISTGGGDADDSRIDIQLRDGPGGSVIREWGSRDVRTSWTNFSLSLSSGQAGSISNYGNLAVSVAIDSIDANQVRISWVEFEAPSPPVTLPVVTTATSNTVTPTGATLGAMVTGTALTARGTIWNTTGVGLTLPHPNALAEGGLVSGVYSHARAGMPVATQVWFTGYATNSAGNGYSTLGTFYTEALQPGTPTFSIVGETGMTVDWTSVPLSTPNVVVVMKSGSAVNAAPTDLTTYTASSTFGGGSDLGSGSFVVYAGPLNSVVVGGLTSGTTYHVALYGYAGIPTMESYNTSAAPTGNQQTGAPITLPTVMLPTFSGIGLDSATLGATLSTDGGGTISERGVVWDTASPALANPAQEGGTSTGTYTQVVSGLPTGSQVFFRGYATNEAGTSYSVGASFYTEPSAATSATTSNIGTTSMRISWTAGGGDGALVMVKQGSPVDALPADGTVYGANAAVGSGDEIGTGNYAVFAASGTQVDVTGLASGTTYWFAVFEYAGSGSGASGVNYRQTGNAVINANTQAGLPSVTVPTVTTVTQTTATLGATLALDGGGTISARGTVWNSTGAPITENAAAEGDAALGAFSHGRTGLTAGSRVWFRGYAVNESGTGYSADASFYTEPTPATGVTFSNVGPVTLRISWTAGGGDGAIVVVKAGGAVDTGPSDGTEHVADAQFGAGAELGTGNRVVYRGAGTHVDVSGLTGQTTYHVAVYEYAGSGSGPSGVNYEQDAPATGQQTTLAPIAVPILSSPTVTSIGGTTATLGATLDSAGGAAVTERGTTWNTTGAPIVENAQAESGTGVGAFSDARSSLPQGVKVWFRGYAENLGGTGYSADSWFHTEPTQASNVTFSEIGASDARIDWTAGGGDGVIVLMGNSGPVTGAPGDGVEYTAGAFGAGSQIAGASVVYAGPANSVVVSGLTDNVTYDVAVFEFAGSGTGPSGINYQQTVPATGSFTSGLVTTHNALHGADCTQCHSVFDTYVPRNTDQETACKQCHNETGAASDKASVALHVTDGGSNVVDCGQCHEIHNSSSYSFDTVDAHVGGITAPNISFIRWNVTKYQPQALEPALFQNRPNQFVFGTGDTPYNGICQTCHTKTGNYTNDGYDDTNGADAATADNSHQQGADCAECHTHLAGFRPGGDDCLACHGLGGSSSYDVEAQFAQTSHHVMGGTVTNDDCGVCHAESVNIWLHADGNIDLRAPDGGQNISFTLPLTRNRSSATLEADVLTVQNDFCMKCHDSDGATVTNFSGNARRPFSSADRDAPDVSAQFDPAQSTFHHPVTQAGANPYTTPTSSNGNRVTMVAPWNQTSNTHDVITCFDCHETTGHGATNQRMLLDAIDFDTMVATTTPSNLPSDMGTSVEDFCSRCHESSVYVTADKPDEVGSRFSEHALRTEDHSASGGNRLGCMACHAGVTNLGGIADNGALPGNLHGSAFTWPTGSGAGAAGTSTEFFILGGYVNGWDINGSRNSATCAGGQCHHSGGGETYSR